MFLKDCQWTTAHFNRQCHVLALWSLVWILVRAESAWNLPVFPVATCTPGTLVSSHTPEAALYIYKKKKKVPKCIYIYNLVPWRHSELWYCNALGVVPYCIVSQNRCCDLLCCKKNISACQLKICIAVLRSPFTQMGYLHVDTCWKVFSSQATFAHIW